MQHHSWTVDNGKTVKPEFLKLHKYDAIPKSLHTYSGIQVKYKTNPSIYTLCFEVEWYYLMLFYSILER